MCLNYNLEAILCFGHKYWKVGRDSDLSRFDISFLCNTQRPIYWIVLCFTEIHLLDFIFYLIMQMKTILRMPLSNNLLKLTNVLGYPLKIYCSGCQEHCSSVQYLARSSYLCPAAAKALHSRCPDSTVADPATAPNFNRVAVIQELKTGSLTRFRVYHPIS